jgi:hypothetical protein
VRTEKEGRLRAENRERTLQKKIDMLSDHIEKLMIHLKHEATAKVRVYDLNTQLQREIEALKERVALLSKASCSKDHVIIELRVGMR